MQTLTKRHRLGRLLAEARWLRMTLGKKCVQGKPCGATCISQQKQCVDIIDGEGRLSTKEAADLLAAHPDHPTTKAFVAWFGSSHKKIQRGDLEEMEQRIGQFADRLPDFASKDSVFRGLAFRSAGEQRAFLDALKSGWENDRPLMSASKRFGAAKRFALKEDHPVILEIASHKTGKDFEPIAKALAPKFVRQREVVFRRKTKFRLVRMSGEVAIGKKKGYFAVVEEE